MNRSIRIVISGGGTGGHVYPGIAIAGELKCRLSDCEIVFVGVRHRIEEKIVPREGYRLKTIHIQYLTRKLSPKILSFFFSLIIGLVQSLIFLIRFRPQVVIGTGGYVSGPVLYAAHLLRIPTLIQEQNSYPGITTKLLAPRVNRIHLAFEETIQHLRVKDSSLFRITGNPVRLPREKIDRNLALAKFNLQPDKKTLFLFGGSQGSAALNEALLSALPQLSPEIQLIWQTGESQFETIKKGCDALPHWIYLQPFIYNMIDAYSAADLALCRAGAITIAELAQMGLPAILVPLPSAAEGHQEKNARVLVDANAALMILQQQLSPKRLSQTISELIFDVNRLDSLSRNCRTFYRENAAAEIADSVIELIEKN
ncbi:MAG: undecaprenyldiphospho-muramoylpentapeptide beta-N-acetylglucosaminyltransferase [bacterium]|nr:undecaprenyldiphospho-muramoylpentapeptide beta-N-acetylglucosaminyltransferase [bacterium]